MSPYRFVRSSALKKMALFCCLTLLVFQPAKEGRAADPRSVEAAAQLLELSGADRMIDMIWPTLSSLMKSNFNAQFPRKEKEVDAVMSVITQEFKSSKGDFISKFAEKYAENFTYEELIYVIDFYKTPTGKKLLDKQPVIMAESNQVGAEISRQIILRIAKNNPKLFEALTP